MLRRLLAVVVSLGLPALLAAQARSTPPAAAKPTFMHGIALQVQGEVVIAAAEPDGQNGDGQNGDGQAGDSQNDDGQNDDGQVGDGQNGDGQNGDGQNGDGQNGDGQNGDGQAGDGQTGDGQNVAPAPAASIGRLAFIGRHRP